MIRLYINSLGFVCFFAALCIIILLIYMYKSHHLFNGNVHGIYFFNIKLKIIIIIINIEDST